VAKRASLLDVLNASGFSTSWISNQIASHLATSNIVAMAQSARHKIWLNVGDEMINYDEIDPYDEDLLKPFSLALAAREPRKAIFLHMNGAHFLYTERYPATFRPAGLSTTSPGRKSFQSKAIYDYDRAVSYNDDMIGDILKQLESKNGDTALVMFSDHGEEVYDQIDWHGHIYPSVTRDMVEIPFFVWLSPSLKARRPELARALKEAAGKRMQVTDISAAIIDIANLKVAGLAPQMRPLIAQFRSTPRRNIDGDYDINPNFGITPTLPPLCPGHGS
jgi:heptose-I-phosphate ethanolaminephosphotransferase